MNDHSADDAERAFADLHLIIAGERCGKHGRAAEPVRNPATGLPLGDVPHASAADLARALEAAQAGFQVWRAASAYERAKVLRGVAERMRARQDFLARLITLEQGKPLGESRTEIANAADMYEWFAEEGRRAYGRVIPSRQPGAARMIVTQAPVGPVAAFAAWNVPAHTMARKVGAALAAGCSIVYKPSEETPATPLAVGALFAEAGLPPGVLNIVFGVPAEVSRTLLDSPIIRKMTFTGSTVVGKGLAGLAAKRLIRTTMELGGHAPVLVFDDADVEATAASAVAAKFRNSGQICTSPTRFYVQEAAHARFAEAFAQHAAALRVGDGLEPGVQMGPCANPRRVEAMERLTEDARARDAAVKAGGARIGNSGYFFQPTLIVDAPDEAMAMNVEPFGPMALTRRFKDMDEAIALANRLPYGLAAYVHTRDARRLREATERIEAGVIAANNWIVSTVETPFGGWKESGWGSEGGAEGLQAFLATKFVHDA